MSIFWLAPAVLLGTALVAVPIAIHVFARQQGRRVAYPSLRFVSPSALAAFRRRTVQDAALLACRMAIIVATVLALAGPVLQTESRSAAHGSRVARAVIVLPGTPPEAAAAAAGEAFVSRTVSRANLDDAIADAVRWLGTQPPASREVLFAGSARRGQLTTAGLQVIPASTGIRFATTASAVSDRDVVLPVLRRQDDTLVIEQRQVHLADNETRVAAGPAPPAPDDLLRIEAAPADRALAAAAVRAVVEDGVRWSRPGRVLVVWEGADEAAVQRAANGATLIRMSRPEPASSAASAVIAAVQQVTAPPSDNLEPVRIDEAQLRAWSRAPAGVPADAPPADEGDRRWFWALALALLALEHALRRATRPAAAETAAEARVA